MSLKQKVYNHYLQLIKEKIETLQHVLDELKESGANETKSTAGDKHETALAMLQIEQANTRGQLNALLDQLTIFNKINPALKTTTVVAGSLIKTNHNYLFLSVALGKALINGVAVIALSPQSPLGSKILGLAKGDNVSIKNMVYLIQDVE
ncbi:MAG: hypothetical protein ABIR81_10615 [Ginsengibacter sp.]